MIFIAVMWNIKEQNFICLYCFRQQKTNKSCTLNKCQYRIGHVSFLSNNEQEIFNSLCYIISLATFVVTAIFVASIVMTSQGQYLAAQGQQQNASQFSANLTGDLTFPPTVTNATGTAEFTVVGDGNTMRYNIDTNNIDKVTDVYVAASSGGRYVDLVQLRSGVNEGISDPINGTLVKGNFTSADFSGRLNVEQMSDLLKLDGNAYIRIQTTDAPLGKIVGKITPNLPS
jgi:CHRD domain-containing protein